MTNEQMQLIRDLRDKGYAVVIWTPEEIQNNNPEVIEERAIEFISDSLIED